MSQRQQTATGEKPRAAHDAQALPSLLSVGEVSEILGVPVATLYRWHSDSGPDRLVGPLAIRVGRHLRYLPTDVTAYIDRLRSAG